LRYMIIVKASQDSEAGVMPEEQLIAEMAKFHEELAAAGVLLDASGLQASSKGWRIQYSGNKRTLIDGPFTETKELIAGYTLIQVASKAEAREWSKRFPNPAGEGKNCEIEVRQLFELEILNPVKLSSGFESWSAVKMINALLFAQSKILFLIFVERESVMSQSNPLLAAS